MLEFLKIKRYKPVQEFLSFVYKLLTDLPGFLSITSGLDSPLMSDRPPERERQHTVGPWHALFRKVGPTVRTFSRLLVVARVSSIMFPGAPFPFFFVFSPGNNGQGLNHL